jgi:hypothetical protein
MAKAKKAKPADKLDKLLSSANVDEAYAQIDSGDPTLARLVFNFNQSCDTTACARKESECYRDYYDGKQWSSDELKILEKRGQPAITDNRIKDKVDYTLGLERKLRTDPKAQPRTPEDDAGADAATSALRYVAECNHFAQTKSSVFENLAIEGFGGCEVIVDNQTYAKTQNKKVLIRYIRWDRLYFDGHSLAKDFSDSRYNGIIKWMDLDEAKAAYPKMSEMFDFFTSQSFAPGSPTYDDKPRWFDRGHKRVQIHEQYFRKGDTWHRAVFSRAGFIEEPAESVYLDSETGKKECPLILQSMYVDKEGNRYGIVKRYKDLQDEINKRRSKSLHLLSVNQALAEKGAVENKEDARKELSRPDGFVEYTPGMKLEVRENADLAEGQFKLLQEAQMALSATGPNEALLGQSGDISGRAKQLDQQGGIITLGIQGDSIRFWQKRVMTAAYNRMKQFWTSEQYIRITEGENTKFMPLNSSYPDNHPHVQKGMKQPGAPMNVMAEMEMDITIDEAPEIATVQQEDFQAMVSLAGDAKVQIPPQALIEASGLSSATKKKVLDAMSGKLPDGTEIPPQIQQMLQAKEAQINQIAQAQAQKTQEQQQTEQDLTQLKAQAQLQQVQLKAQMDQFQAQQKAFQAEQAAKQLESQAQMEMLNAKEIELKSLQLLAAQNLKATQDAANAVVDGSAKEAAINVLTSKLETQQHQHAADLAKRDKQMADLGVTHNQQLHQEREKARAATTAQQETKGEKPKSRKITVERDSQGRVSGATVN